MKERKINLAILIICAIFPLRSEAFSMKNSMSKPSLPLPNPLVSTEPGTWAFDTMSRRVNEEILQRTYDENEDFFKENPVAMSKFTALREDLQNASSTSLRLFELLEGEVAEDIEEWNKIIEPHISEGKTWLSTPWLIAEFYLYRRLLADTGYFDAANPNTFKRDLFERQKRAGTESSPATAEGILERVSKLTKFSEDNLAVLLSIPLWGNQMDLSIWPTDTSDNNNQPSENALLKVIENSHENLLWDDTNDICSYCSKLPQQGNVDIVVDNAGLELITDLVLADYLITSGIASQVTFRLKSFPTFVSDAMEKDLRHTVEYFSSLDQNTYKFCKEAGERWNQYLSSDKWICKEDDFWVQGKPMWEMPNALRSEMSKSIFAIIKGDANYRRLLGDLEWDLSQDSFQNVVGDYFPCHVIALRTLKAMMGCGMEPEKVERAKKIDPNWMVNGKFGVVQFGVPPI